MNPELIEAARAALEAGETTRAGRPKVEAMQKILGRDVTAEERDAAFQAIQENQTIEEGETMPKETQAPGALVYVGPALSGDVHVRQFTTFRGGLPEKLKDEADADPALARLFVAVEALHQARAELARQGSVLSRAFSDVAQTRERRS